MDRPEKREELFEKHVELLIDGVYIGSHDGSCISLDLIIKILYPPTFRSFVQRVSQDRINQCHIVIISITGHHRIGICFSQLTV